MSHDRGCFCGRERYEYDDCKDPTCHKREKTMVNHTYDDQDHEPKRRGIVPDPITGQSDARSFEKAKASSANDIQVGGLHYRSELQHWDLIERHGVGYLEGCASKYVTRWRKKNGVEDLKKSVHYIQKLIELFREGVRGQRGSVPLDVLKRFAVANGLTEIEDKIVRLLCTWTTAEELETASALTTALIEGAAKSGPTARGA